MIDTSRAAQTQQVARSEPRGRLSNGPSSEFSLESFRQAPGEGISGRVIHFNRGSPPPLVAREHVGPLSSETKSLPLASAAAGAGAENGGSVRGARVG